MAGTNDHNERIGYLDGIRGLAILLVAAGHIFYEIYIFQIGWIGLNLFFILSGYLITQRLYVHVSGSTLSYFKDFYGRRILRIFPLYYGCLIVFFIFLPLIYPGYYKFYGELYNLQGWYWTYASNWMIIIKGLPDSPGLFHFWSLAVEEQFYIVWPFLFLFLVRLRHAPVIITFLILISVFLRNYISQNTNSYLSTTTPAEPLLLGALITILEKREKIEKSYKLFFVFAILSIITLVIIFIHDQGLHITNDWLLHTGYTAIDLIWIFILLLCILNKKELISLRKLFNAKWIKWLGKYSYGIYVFHWIVLNFLIYKGVTELVDRGVDNQLAYFSVRIAGIILILVLSYFSYNWYEKRFLALKKYFRS
jgi:peptidoglycan/LPS O-acetylase OafA/YrhL